MQSGRRRSSAFHFVGNGHFEGFSERSGQCGHRTFGWRDIELRIGRNGRLYHEFWWRWTAFGGLFAFIRWFFGRLGHDGGVGDGLGVKDMGIVCLLLLLRAEEGPVSRCKKLFLTNNYLKIIICIFLG